MQFVAAKGGTVYVSKDRVFIDFSKRMKPTGMGVLCSNERLICPNYSQPSSFSESDLHVLDRIIWLRSVDFTCSKVSKSDAFLFRDAHPDCAVGFDSKLYVPKTLVRR